VKNDPQKYVRDIVLPMQEADKKWKKVQKTTPQARTQVSAFLVGDLVRFLHVFVFVFVELNWCILFERHFPERNLGETLR
jgi:hypothetical protein